MFRKLIAYTLILTLNAGLTASPASAFVPSCTNGGSASMGFDTNKSSATGVTNNNSTTTAEEGKITYNVGGDMTGQGYVAKAQDIDANIEGDLKLESLQDTYYSNNSGFGVNAGVGFGNKEGGNMLAGANANTVSSVSGGFNISSGYTDMIVPPAR
ncbi:hemagluttinin repeat-containing protein [Parelusimicrobium proximum]|uniref:hemagglutinin repeat-containing protein n=1 Tax=Parelusimicrobium proximum TaxID=3228953 RepID=UPI003D1823EA